MAIKIECQPSDIHLFVDRLVAAEREAATYRMATEHLQHEVQSLRFKADQDAVTVRANLVELMLAVEEDNKINAIKAIRILSGLGLKESKDLVESSFPLGHRLGPYQGG